jgi:hypothetical protein
MTAYTMAQGAASGIVRSRAGDLWIEEQKAVSRNEGGS